MQYQEFIRMVKEKSRLSIEEDAACITEATLETLGERLYRTERENLAAQLPHKLKEYIFKRQEPEPTNRGHTDHYSLQEFYNRVGARSGESYYDTAQRAKAVMSVLQQATSPGILDQVFSVLPGNYRDLLEEEPSGPGFPSVRS